ncbi:YgaP family membrane protein [Calidifontibacillus oryziterrae]|uniref:YgaP family membrane protein n=1 Tax=Calidifontibacillus oryziterrae TaxID=1191699 RepID=UPI000476C741|nr:DUF2892 domain-containing protein [Calidifontibacillus oryziterrae]
MMVKPNIGLVNALVRITFGFTILAWATAKMVKRPWRNSYFWVALMAGMKIAEGITRFCPLTALFERYQENLLPNDTTNNNDNASEPLVQEIANSITNP